MMNNINIINTLIEAGVLLYIQDKYGLTPLNYGKSLISSNFL